MPLCARSFAMSTAVSPSVPTTTGSSYSRSPWRRIAGDSLIGVLLTGWVSCVGHRLSVREWRSHRPYRVAVAVRAQPVTAGEAPDPRAGPRGWFPWWAVVAPWLASRLLCVAVLLAAVDDPSRG